MRCGRLRALCLAGGVVDGAAWQRIEFTTVKHDAKRAASLRARTPLTGTGTRISSLHCTARARKPFRPRHGRLIIILLSLCRTSRRALAH